MTRASTSVCGRPSVRRIRWNAGIPCPASSPPASRLRRSSCARTRARSRRIDPIAAGSLVGRIAKGVLLDPTTYTPAVLSYEGMRLDWNTSQVFFQHGFIEQNARFTMSGLPNDQPLGYHAGNREILSIALDNLQTSLVNNVGDRIFEEWLLAKYPNHPKVVKTFGWIERIGFASYLSYLRAGPHFTQWQQNQRLAGEMGLR
jgi:hypothetical protein